MNTDRICPLDDHPCEKDCPDRFTDTPDGGCRLTLSLDMGINVLCFDDAGNFYLLAAAQPGRGPTP